MTAARPSMIKAVKAKCRDCMGGFKDGRHDCQVPTCSLYYWMPYRKLEPAWKPPPPRQQSAAQQAAIAARKTRAKVKSQGNDAADGS